ncbi:hypothetical protein HMPREF2846_12760 [Staphylococcus sp. HMSC056G08]|nr:hypothetical protein HMPREF2846_12760 [Staphylococcus sp. HMSC056G08]
MPVTVTYPDGTRDHVTVKVTVTPQPQNDKYEPTAGEITKPYGRATTEDEVKGKVSVPDFPKEGDLPVITVDTTKVPDGKTRGEFEVPVTVTYPDKTTDTVNVKVTVGPKDSDTYEPTTQPITKPFGQGTTEQEVKDKVTVPNFPADKGTPIVTVDDSTKVPNGQTPGTFDVPVTVTYPDGTKDYVTVKVTVNPQPQNDKYEPTAGEITKPYGTPTTPEEVKEKVSVPDFPKDGGKVVVTIDDPTTVPSGNASGVFEVPVTVTYPDGSKDHVTVKIVVAPQPAPQPEETNPTAKGTTPESTPTIDPTSESNPTIHTRAKRSLDTEPQVEAPVNNETYNGKIIDYTGSDLVKKVANPGQIVAPDYIDFSPKFKDHDSKSYSFLTNQEIVTSTKTTTTNGGSIHAYFGDYITLDDNQPEAYVYINNVGTANGHKVDALVHVKMDPPSKKFPTNKRYFFTSGRDMLSMTSQDGGGATANIKFMSNIDKTKLDDFYNKIPKGTPITSVIEGLKNLNDKLHPVSGLLNIYDLDDYDRNKEVDVRKSVTFNRNEINELYISNKTHSEATANLELKDNKIIISTGEQPRGAVEDYPNRVTATFKEKSELTYSMTGRNA